MNILTTGMLGVFVISTTKFGVPLNFPTAFAAGLKNLPTKVKHLTKVPIPAPAPFKNLAFT